MCNGHKIKQDTSGNYSGLLIWEPVPPCGEETGERDGSVWGGMASSALKPNQERLLFFFKQKTTAPPGQVKTVEVKVFKALCKSGNIPQQIKAFLSDAPPCWFARTFALKEALW